MLLRRGVHTRCTQSIVLPFSADFMAFILQRPALSKGCEQVNISPVPPTPDWSAQQSPPIQDEARLQYVSLFMNRAQPLLKHTDRSCFCQQPPSTFQFIFTVLSPRNTTLTIPGRKRSDVLCTQTYCEHEVQRAASEQR